jgi:uncharacterized membrane protein
MQLSPEEKRKIYEEEKARIEAEEKAKQEERVSADLSSTNLEPNVAGLLCYLGTWITGIIFLLLEQKNRFVRFHAIQSIAIFGMLMVASAALTQLPLVGWFFGSVIGVLTFILWIVLMVKAYKGELYKIPVAGDIAESVAGVSAEKGGARADISGEAETYAPTMEHGAPARPVDRSVRAPIKTDMYPTSTKSGRLTASSFAIAWSIVLLIFFNYFNRYIAYYQYEGGNRWLGYSILTEDFNAWLPILTVTLILSIIGHILLIIFDRYILREITLIVLNLFGLAVVLTLLSIFPFDFTTIPNATAVAVSPVVVTIILIGITIGLTVGTIVRFIKLIVNVIKGTASY